MKLTLHNTSHGLIPQYDEDYEEKKKLKIGQNYVAEITQPRNLGFHRKFFALVKIGYDNLPEDLIDPHPSFDVYRKMCIVRAGFYRIYKTERGQFIEAESMSFGNMSEERFSELYNRILDVILLDVGMVSSELEDMVLDFT